MRSRTLAVVIAVAAAVPTVAHGDPGGVAFVPAARSNYSHAFRRSSLVRQIVVHVAEGSYTGTVSWFRNRKAHASANYVVSRDGAVTQMVPDDRVAWHAGNAAVNLHSIGIEHEGYTFVPGTFTDAEYRASAELVASLLRHYVLPIDRRHVIGHNEVPDPLHPWLHGGFAHHKDPGPSWDWTRYMAYVRAYAQGRTPPPPDFDVVVPDLELNQTVSSLVPWQAEPLGTPAERVDFLIDGKLRDTEREPPYVFGGDAGGWDTSGVANGRYTLTARAVSLGGRRAVATVVVNVRNAPTPPIQVVALDGVADSQPVWGPVQVELELTRPVQRVEFLVDGIVRWRALTPPYVFDWDTSTEGPGPHELTAAAIVKGYAVAARTVTVDVEPPADTTATTTTDTTTTTTTTTTETTPTTTTP
ncbi:MAG TPA: N-acetylmuramoyl-L-alanine amidase [Gaiellaceae bacterium]